MYIYVRTYMVSVCVRFIHTYKGQGDIQNSKLMFMFKIQASCSCSSFMSRNENGQGATYIYIVHHTYIQSCSIGISKVLL